MGQAQFVFDDLTSICVAVFVAVLVGLSKGGIGGTTAILGVAIMSLIISPVQAAGILLPVLLVMDFIACWVWRKSWDKPMVWMMLPAGLAGVVAGWMMAAYVSDAVVRLVIGGIATVYLIQYVSGLRGAEVLAKPQDPIKASVWGFLSGYGSFVAHSGGPAYQIYAMPLKAAPAVFTATSTLFFTIINVAKVFPYAALGQFDPSNLFTSVVLMPIAAVATLAGAWIVRRIPMGPFYAFMHVMLLLVTVKLIWDGLTGL